MKGCRALKEEVTKLNKVVIKLHMKVKEMETNILKVETKKKKMKFKVLVYLPHPWCYPTLCLRWSTPEYEYNEIRDSEMDLEYDQNLNEWDKECEYEDIMNIGTHEYKHNQLPNEYKDGNSQMTENNNWNHETSMHKDPDYHYEDPLHDNGYTDPEYDSNNEHPVHDSDHGQEDAGFDHPSSRLLDKLTSQRGSLIVDYGCSSHEQVGYERQVEDLVHEDHDCDYENSWLGSCLPFGFSEDSEHGDPQTFERVGHIWDYQSSENVSSDE